MKTVLSAIFPSDTSRLYYLQEKVEDGYFSGNYLDLWRIINRVSHMTGGLVATEEVIKQTLDRAVALPIERRASIEDTLADIMSGPKVSEVDFRSSVAFLEEEYKRNKLGSGLSDAMEILTSGIHKGSEIIHGVEPAVESLYMTIAEIEQVSNGVMPEGNVFEELAELIKELEEGNAMERVLTGVRPLDEMTYGGIGMGEFWLIAAYAGVGKTFFCSNLAYHFAMNEGKNVVYLTAETLRPQVRQRMLIRHSHDPKFNIPNGLSSSLLKKHSPDNPQMTQEQITQYREVMKDFGTLKEGRGIMHVGQISMGAKISTIQAKLNKLNNTFPIDVVVVDSLDLLSPEVRRQSSREELNDILASAKLLATSFDNGRGVRLISPWQTSRQAWKDAHEQGRYTKASMAETSEAERKADLILALLEDRSNPFKLKGQTLKFRDSEGKDFELSIDYDRCYVGSNERVDTSFESALAEAFDV
jgi:replicative DNA helicase